MSEFEDLVPDLEQKADEQELRKLAVTRKQGREAAVEGGRRLGEDEADRRGEVGLLREQRVGRAMAYAAWEFDGKPIGGGQQYEEEFQIKGRPQLPGWVRRGGADPKNGRRK